MISQKTRTSLKITIGTIMVTFGTLLLVAFASGYNFDIFRGEIYSTGLVLLGSNPSGANISINNKTLTQKTPYRLENFKVGSISIEYSRPDYINWKSSYQVKPGEVTFADYALLIPKNIEQLNEFTKLKFNNLQTSEEKYRVFGFLDSPGSIYELDKNSNPKKIIELPPNPSLQNVNSLSGNALSSDGSSIITRATYPDASSTYFWIDTGSAQLINVESLLGQKPNDIKFNQRNSKEFYNLLAGKIRRLNVDNKQILDLNISNVASYQLDKDHIYTLENLSSAEQGQFLVRYDYNGNNRYVLSQLPSTSSPQEMKVTEFNGQKLISIRNVGDGSLIIFRQKDGKNLTSTIGNGVKMSSFSPNGRFISYIQNDKFKTIDLETGDRFSADSIDTNSISWLTNFQIILSKPNGLYIVDYDGNNLNKLPPNSSNTSDYRFTTQFDTKGIYYILGGNLSYFTLQPKGLINFR